jgi:hypothetical protein
MSAAEYADKTHTVLRISSSHIVRSYCDQIELAHMNTGNTRPFPHPRGRDTFRRMEEYDYTRRGKLADYSSVVELTVIGGVDDMHKHVIRVEHAYVKRGAYVTQKVLFEQ